MNLKLGIISFIFITLVIVLILYTGPDDYMIDRLIVAFVIIGFLAIMFTPKTRI